MSIIRVINIVIVLTLSEAHLHKYSEEDNLLQGKLSADRLHSRYTEVLATQNRNFQDCTNCSTNNFQRDNNTCETLVNCAPWMVCENHRCVCNRKLDRSFFLKCEEHTGILSVINCYCVTYDNETGLIEVGACFENCMNMNTNFSHDHIHHVTYSPNDNVSMLNHAMCGRFNRDGRLCGKCLPGFSPQAYSFDITCVNCTERIKNLWKYFVFSFTPLTCFYLIVLFFKINTTSSHLFGFVLFAQATFLPEFARIVFLTLKFRPSLDFPVRLLGTLYGFWNLDFFRTFNLGICLDMSPLSVRALDYTVAVYPLVLTILSYILIELHDRNYKIVVFVWKPFRCIFTLFRRNWDIRTSVIDAYATFYMLSFFNVLNVSFDLLIPTYVYTVSESEPNKTLVLYYDGTVEFFGQEHLPYAVVGVFMTVFFAVLPILLLLVYPCQCFQYLLNRCHINSHILRTFMDAFQGCYKDGTEPGTRDCRWFAGFDFFCRVLTFVMFSFTLGSMFFPIATLVILLGLIIFSQVQPHKANVAHFNKINLAFYCLLALYYTALTSMNLASIKQPSLENGCLIFSVVVGCVPLLYVSCISIHWIFSRRKWGRKIFNRMRAWRRSYEELEESLPDRLENPDQYYRKSMDITASVVTQREAESGDSIEYTY